MIFGRLVLMVLLVNVTSAREMGWMNDIESSDDSNAHAVGELGRLDPAYQMSERVRAQTMAVASGASKLEAVFEKRLASMLQEAAAEPPAHPWRAAEYPQPYGHSKANGHAPHCIGDAPAMALNNERQSDVETDASKFVPFMYKDSSPSGLHALKQQKSIQQLSLSTQPAVTTTSSASTPATEVAAKKNARLGVQEHGSNSLWRTISKPKPPAVTSTSQITTVDRVIAASASASSAHALRAAPVVAHGSNTLLKVLTGSGATYGAHQNSILYHATTPRQVLRAQGRKLWHADAL